jgi:hypothetical protein
MGDARIDFANANARTCRCQSPRCVANSETISIVFVFVVCVSLVLDWNSELSIRMVAWFAQLAERILVAGPDLNRRERCRRKAIHSTGFVGPYHRYSRGTL